MTESINGIFSQDHRELDAIFAQFQKLDSDDLVQRTRLFSEFQERLVCHIEAEESVLFPYFESATGMTEMGPTKVMCIEHKMIIELLEQISFAVSRKASTTLLEQELIQILNEHNQKEERVLYPHIDRIASSELICQSMRALHADKAELTALAS